MALPGLCLSPSLAQYTRPRLSNNTGPQPTRWSGRVSFLLASDLAASRSAVGPWGLALAGPKDHLIALMAMIGQTFGLHGSRSSPLMQHYCAVLRLVEVTLCPDLAAERPKMEHRKKVLLEPSKAGNGV